jgi:hypothetical protein
MVKIQEEELKKEILTKTLILMECNLINQGCLALR